MAGENIDKSKVIEIERVLKEFGIEFDSDCRVYTRSNNNVIEIRVLFKYPIKIDAKRLVELLEKLDEQQMTMSFKAVSRKTTISVYSDYDNYEVIIDNLDSDIATLVLTVDKFYIINLFKLLYKCGLEFDSVKVYSISKLISL